MGYQLVAPPLSPPSSESKSRPEAMEVSEGGGVCGGVRSQDAAPTVATEGPVASPSDPKRALVASKDSRDALPEADVKITPRNSAVILDWDDTLCPTSWLRALKVTSRGSRLSRDMIEELYRLQASAIAVLAKVRTYCDTEGVVIITNGESGWVKMSCESFLPGLIPYLKGIRVVSARSDYEGAFPGDPFKWKELAFQRELYAMSKGRRLVNVLSLGDSAQECDAVGKATPAIRGVRYTKSVKLVDRPTVSLMRAQLNFLSSRMHRLINVRKCFDIMIGGEGVSDYSLKPSVKDGS